MLNFPDYSDLGNSGASKAFVDEWSSMIAKVERCAYYYEGDVFEERVEVDPDASPEEAPLKYPARLNLVRSVVDAMTTSAFGDFAEMPIALAVRGDLEAKDADDEAIRVLSEILHVSGGARFFYEVELDRNLYGGAAIEIMPRLARPGLVFRKISRFSFFPIWSADDPDELIEVNVVTYLTREQAQDLYTIVPQESNNYFLPLSGRVRGFVERRIRYTKGEITIYLNGKEIDSKRNPWGTVPFVYIPRYRAENWFGESVALELIGQQNELNARIADMGDAISYNAHPIRYGYNLPSNFNARNFPLSPDAFWNLGRVMPGGPEPRLGTLEVDHAVTPEALNYVNFLYDWARTNNSTPPIAFGVDNGGGQRSSSTLEIRLWPVKRMIQMTRGYLADGLSRMFAIAGVILLQRNYQWCSQAAAKALIERRITCNFNQVLPRDFQKSVDDVVRLLSTNPPAISLQTAMAYLGFPKAEVERIEEMLKNDTLWRKTSSNVPGPLSSSVHKEEKIEDNLSDR